MRRTKECAEQTKRSIMAAAFDVFLRDGYESSSLEKICRAANVTRGAAYWHFKNKRDLYHQTITDTIEQMDRVRDIIVTSESLGLADKLVELLWIPNEYAEQFRFVGLATEFYKPNPGFTEIASAVEQSEMRLYWYFLTELSKLDGSSTPVEEVATIFYTVFLGMHGYSVSSGITKNMNKETVRIFVNLMVDKL